MVIFSLVATETSFWSHLNRRGNKFLHMHAFLKIIVGVSILKHANKKDETIDKGIHYKIIINYKS